MSILNRIKTWLRSKSIDSPPERRLNAESEAVLSASLRNLILGADGWITLDEARRLFSPVKEPRYAFGEVDDVGKSSLEAFAARNQCKLDIIAGRSRVFHAAWVSTSPQAGERITDLNGRGIYRNRSILVKETPRAWTLVWPTRIVSNYLH